ncbi:MAG: hypothetical protein KDA60_05725, partial [Planctomycetales bacterium]|nr:hypothetical protein [Planctomycetales bacterium]
MISGNDLHGIWITGINATENQVIGNYIGTDVNGMTAVPNGAREDVGDGNGVLISHSAAANVIGGDSAHGNVISGNDGAGVRLLRATGNEIFGNIIGLDATGNSIVSNNGDGVDIVASPGTKVGKAGPGFLQVISGNDQHGVDVSISLDDGTPSEGTLLVNNYIGLNLVGDAARGNAGGGVLIDGSRTIIGQANQEGVRNVISGNAGNGIDVSEAVGIQVIGNFIGTTALGEASLGNMGHGIDIRDSASNAIGGSNSLERNVISGNLGSGVSIVGENADDNAIRGNLIGLAVDGVHVLGNQDNGVFINSGDRTIIGGTTVGDRNVISGNANNGVYLFGPGVTETEIKGNFIGTEASGSAAAGNGGNGVLLINASLNQIGSLTTGSNVISGNAENGVGISASNAGFGNVLEGNLIG